MYLNGAGTAVDGRRQPNDHTITVNQDINVQSHIELPIVTVREIKTKVRLNLQLSHLSSKWMKQTFNQ